MPTIIQALKKLQKLNQNMTNLFLSFFITFKHLSVVEVSFYGLIKGISPKMYTPCVRVKINKCSFEPFCVWILF